MAISLEAGDQAGRTIFDVQRILAALFLRSEFTLAETDHPLTRARNEVFARLGLQSNPVVGVGIFGIDGPSEIHLALENEMDLDLGYLAERFGAPGVTIASRVTGRNRPASRPALGGDSLGDPHGSTGTLGCIVENVAGDKLVLSCNHVIAGVNSATIGDDVWQPGKLDGGTRADIIGTLHDCKPIDFALPNDIDAALAAPTVHSNVSTNLRRLGRLIGYDASPRHGTSVDKVGWRTGQTSGTLHYKNFSLLMPFAGHGQALFDGQYGIVGTHPTKHFSKDGDSGAVVVNGNSEVVGLLFGNAAGIDLSYANPIEPILDHFAVALV